MRCRDGSDDRQAKPGAPAGASLIGSAEALKGVVAELLGKAAPLIGDLDHQLAGLDPGLDLYRAAAVPQRVVEQVAEGLLRPQRIDRYRVSLRRRPLDTAPTAALPLGRSGR